MRIVKWFSWLGFVLIVTGSVVGWMGYSRVNTIYEPTVTVPTITVDSTLLARGEHLSYVWGCRDCHGDQFEGKIIFDQMPTMQVIAPNLTKGAGGEGAKITEVDWVRAIRYGLHTDGKPLFYMPSDSWTTMSDYDVMAVIRYLETVPAVDNALDHSELGLKGYLMAGLGELNIWHAEHVRFDALPENTVIPAVTVEYGAYIAQKCMGCHMPNLEGGKNTVIGFPDVPSLRQDGNLGSWSKEEFVTTLTSGRRPDGSRIDPLHMPWEAFKYFDQTEIDALYLFLTSLN